MPLMNSMGALKQQHLVFSPIVGDQWIATFLNYDDPYSHVQLDNSGNVYAFGNKFGVTGGTIFKISSVGVKIFSTVTNNTGFDVMTIDASNNVYVASSNNEAIYKYDSSGNIVWQISLANSPTYSSRVIRSMIISPSGDLFVLNGSTTGGAPTNPSTPTNNIVYSILKIDSSTGTIINQRRTLNYTTSAPSNLLVDSVNNKLIITGTDYSTSKSQVLNGIYDFTNTDTASVITYQVSTTDDYSSFNGTYCNTVATDGTYIYMIVNRVISGVTRTVYTRINRTTGVVSYSNELNFSGQRPNLNSITIDNSGFIYVCGNWAGGSPASFVSKINASTGSVVWAKTISGFSSVISNLTWKSGFLYFSARVYQNVSGTFRTIYSSMKWKDTGSILPGTYGTFWTISNTTPTTTSLLPQTTGTTTGANSTSSWIASTTTNTVSTDSSTISTIYIV